eukprot:560989-Amphidinium_carterae.2
MSSQLIEKSKPITAFALEDFDHNTVRPCSSHDAESLPPRGSAALRGRSGPALGTHTEMQQHQRNQHQAKRWVLGGVRQPQAKSSYATQSFQLGLL